MANLKKTLDSGARIEIQVSSFEVCNRLLKTVMREVDGVKVSLGIKSGAKNLGDLELNDDALNTIKSFIARIISSESVESVLWECMPVVLYNDGKVTRDTFENIEARADYLPLMKEVLVYNLTPFFKNLNSLFAGFVKSINTQKQE